MDSPWTNNVGKSMWSPNYVMSNLGKSLCRIPITLPTPPFPLWGNQCALKRISHISQTAQVDFSHLAIGLDVDFSTSGPGVDFSHTVGGPEVDFSHLARCPEVDFSHMDN